MIVKAFGEAKTVALGEIDLKVLIGPCEPFVVVEIPTIFNLLFGRPWTYNVGAPSILHQVKFILENILILVMVEEELTITSSTYALYAEAQQTEHPSSYVSFAVVTVSYNSEGKAIPEPKLSTKDLMIGKYLKKVIRK